MDNKQIGGFVASLRKKKGFTQQQLADMLGITNKAVSKWETGESLPDIGLLPSLCEVLGTTADELLQGHETTGPKQTPYPKTASHLLSKAINNFKALCYISFGMAVFGLMVAWLIWSEIQNHYALLGGIMLQFSSIIIFVSGYFTLKTKVESYRQQYPGELQAFPLMQNTLTIGIGLWILLPVILGVDLLFRYLPFAYVAYLPVVVTVVLYLLVMLLVWTVTRKK